MVIEKKMKYKVAPELGCKQVENEEVADTDRSFLDVSFGDETVESPVKLKTKLSGDSTSCRCFNPRAMWKQAFFRVRVQLAMQRFTQEVTLYGTNELLLDSSHYKHNLDALLDQKVNKLEHFRRCAGLETEKQRKSRFLLRPGSPLKAVWNVILVVLLVYTALIVPYRLAFSDSVYWDFWTGLDVCVDGLFLIDIGVTLCSSYYQEEDGLLVDNWGDILRNYLKGWLLVDLTSSFPYSVLDFYLNGESGAKNYNHSTRLARLPRLYKLIRISRIAKAVRVYSNTDFFSKIEECTHINSRIYKLGQFLLVVSVGVHIVACLWYFSAQLEADITTSWLARYHYLDSSHREQYIAAVYWAVTTVVTVGYGDISAKTELEQSICVIWMSLGVGFYSFTIGSLSSFLTSIDTRESILTAKMAAVQEFAIETGIDFDTKRKIRNAVRYHTWKTGSIWSDKNSLFSDLPKRLQLELAEGMFNSTVKDFPFFSRANKQFLLYFLPLFKPTHYTDDECVYRQADHADEVFFISKGRVSFVLAYQEVVYKSYVTQAYFGEIEVIKAINRLDSTKTLGECELLTLHKRDFERGLAEFPSEAKKIKKIAGERLSRHKSAMKKMYELLSLKVGPGIVSKMTVKERLLSYSEPANAHSLVQLSVRMASLEREVDEMRQTVTELKGGLQDLLKEAGLGGTKLVKAQWGKGGTVDIEIIAT